MRLSVRFFGVVCRPSMYLCTFLRKRNRSHAGDLKSNKSSACVHTWPALGFGDEGLTNALSPQKLWHGIGVLERSVELQPDPDGRTHTGC